MIPADTPIGSEIVCIADTNADPAPGDSWLPDPTAGEVCIVERIEADHDMRSGSNVLIAGYEALFSTDCFRLLEKPHELYSLLETATRETETVG